MVQRDSIDLHRHSRHHVWWLLVKDEIFQCLDIYLLITNDIGSNELTSAFLIKGLHSSIFDTWELANDCLYFLQFDTETANLHLSIITTHKLDIAIRQIAHDVAGAINTGVLFFICERVLYIHLCRFIRTIQIATTYLRTTDPQFSCCTYRHTTAMSINDIKMCIVDWLADRYLLLLLVNRICRSEYSTLSRRRQRCQFLASYGEMLQRVVLDACGKLIAHLSGHERMGDIVLLEVFIQRNEVETQLLRDDIYGGSTGERGIHIHHAGIEAITGVCSHMMLWLEVVITLIPMAETYQVGVRQLTALRNTRRTRGVEQNEKRIRSNRETRKAWRIWKTRDILRQ